MNTASAVHLVNRESRGLLEVPGGTTYGAVHIAVSVHPAEQIQKINIFDGCTYTFKTKAEKIRGGHAAGKATIAKLFRLTIHSKESR